MDNISPALYDSDVSLRQPHLDEDLENPLLSNVLHAYISTSHLEPPYDDEPNQEHFVAEAVAKAASTYPDQGQSHTLDQPEWNSYHQQPQSQETAAIKLVQYDPDQKTKRLGRPRKNIKHNLSAPENSSSDNLNEARYAKFRFDNKPILGPGSRGGKNAATRSTAKGKLTFNKIRERQLQATLSFDNKLGLVLSKESVQDDISGDMDPTLVEQSLNSTDVIENAQMVDEQFVREQKGKDDESIGQVSQKVNGLAATPSVERISISYRRSAMVTGASRTSFIRSRKSAKSNSRTLAPLHYELYDDRLIESHTYANESKFPLALGFPLVPSPYAKDILTIQAFLTKFRHIINVGYLGPQDFEDGLGLPSVDPISCFTQSNVNLRPQEINETNDENSSASLQKIQDLLYRLLSLILNRKKGITSLLRASAELKTQFDSFAGTSNGSKLSFNPFLLPLFDTLGLAAIPSPEERLTFLRVLVQWAMSASELIRTYITDVYEGYGDNEYVSRYIQSFGSAHDSDYSASYITKDIYEDPCSIRVLDFYAGDCGLNVGRFYLSRMADAKAGGPSSIRNMEMAIRRKGIDIGDSSTFKLYVQDVHQMLSESLTSFGVEFDELGNEIDEHVTQSNYWYEVASNSKELSEFLEFLGKKLGFLETTEVDSIPIRRSGKFYEAASSLYSYLISVLPLLLAHEEMRGSNATRRRRKDVNYNEITNARKAATLEYESDTDFEMELNVEDNAGSDYSGEDDDDDE